MAELQTKLNDAPVADFLNAVESEQVRQDCWDIVDIMQAATNAEPKMWGDSIVGFGSYHYKYASGREGDWMLIGLSPRKKNITLYIMGCYGWECEELTTKLGKFSRGKGCLYIKQLSDIHRPTLEQLIQASLRNMANIYPPTQSE